MNDSPTRSWGYWTQAKLAILRDYLSAFLTASARADEVIYLDAFAGEGAGVDRLTGEVFHGSARIALDASEGDGFTRLRYFEISDKATALEQRLKSEFPGRDIKVYGGDCNSTIATALDELKSIRWAPTFAFLDPDGMQLAWSTLESLAAHKRGYKKGSGTEFKVELWMLFPTQGVIRTLALDDAKLLQGHESKATSLFGGDCWRPTYDARKRGELSAAAAREEYLNLMRWRLVEDLGYKKTHPFELNNLQGRTIYHMIFATDNATGDKIMGDLYAKAAANVPEVRAEAKNKKSGQLSLDVGADSAATYEHAPPWKPLGWTTK